MKMILLEDPKEREAERRRPLLPGNIVVLQRFLTAPVWSAHHLTNQVHLITYNISQAATQYAS